MAIKLRGFLFNLALFLSASNNLALIPLNAQIIVKNKQPIINQNLEISNNSLIQENINNKFDDYYILGPGDILFLTIFDMPELSGTYPIFNDGKAQMPFIGNVDLTNLSLIQATEKLSKLFANELLRPEIFLTVKQPRPIKVSIIGEVNTPGLYIMENKKEKEINYFPNLVDAIQLAGGITNNTNLKEITLIRKIPGEKKELKKAKLNFIDLIKKGDQSQNPYLFDGDIIKLEKAEEDYSKNTFDAVALNLSPSFIKITVVGEVNNPGLIKIPPNTPLIQAVMIAGDAKDFIANRSNVELIRINRNGSITRDNYNVNRKGNISKGKNPLLKNGDIIKVKKSKSSSFAAGLNSITAPVKPLIDVMTLYKLFGD
ncbi:MAG: SLBB domain-containing protein [Prochlorococcus marinus CUG1439]|uniref:SLBB domain-containing protein n=1 Tax=Prochlorococcus sp. MIT 1314 TaxID=3096220 RepID=UPI001B1EEC28|nr:SLBB domain-containing protein [Prochlorococcus sp. MIT 1314]MCR8538809.1 SLBB domain-containing protein [Prochlorococcus marinus CUG1439]